MSDKAPEFTQIGKVLIDRKIGQGGMGSVYLGRHQERNIQVAVKILSPEIARSNPDFAERFVREAKLSAQLRHPNVVQVFEGGIFRGTYYYVMEYVEGESLKGLLRQQPRFPWRKALNIMGQIAQALVLAGQKNIVHRDIKPDNILMTLKGVAKLADMGLAKRTTDDHSMTMTSTAMGTPYYMSPEQCRDSKHVDTRSDLYSLGATLFHLLTGRVPFQLNSAFEIMRAQIEDPLPDVKKFAPEVPQDVVAILLKMMAKNADERYQKAEDFIQDVALVLNDKKPKVAQAKAVVAPLALSLEESSAAVAPAVQPPAPTPYGHPSGSGGNFRTPATPVNNNAWIKPTIITVSLVALLITGIKMRNARLREADAAAITLTAKEQETGAINLWDAARTKMVLYNQDPSKMPVVEEALALLRKIIKDYPQFSKLSEVIKTESELNASVDRIYRERLGNLRTGASHDQVKEAEAAFRKYISEATRPEFRDNGYLEWIRIQGSWRMFAEAKKMLADMKAKCGVGEPFKNADRALFDAYCEKAREETGQARIDLLKDFTRDNPATQLGNEMKKGVEAAVADEVNAQTEQVNAIFRDLETKNKSLDEETIARLRPLVEKILVLCPNHPDAKMIQARLNKEAAVFPSRKLLSRIQVLQADKKAAPNPALEKEVRAYLDDTKNDPATRTKMACSLGETLILWKRIPEAEKLASDIPKQFRDTQEYKNLETSIHNSYVERANNAKGREEKLKALKEFLDHNPDSSYREEVEQLMGGSKSKS